jgi:D-alanyl-D-alanine carboxypeptidase
MRYAVCLLLVGCATAPPPAPPASRPLPSRPSTAALPPPSAAPAPLPPPPPRRSGPRLAWVNPARCLPACTYDPSPTLVRVDEAGEPSARGAHRVADSAQPALRDLIAAARQAGHLVKVSSAFRSYRDQARVWNGTKEPGRAARPGHSEHQLGTAIDLRLPTTAAIDWLAEHAPSFGFALSYPDGRQRITGYRPEPWHVRFLGRELAEQIHGQGTTVEETLRAEPDLAEWGSCQDCPLSASRSSCGKVTVDGLCQGTVLTWCYDGALATVDCAVSGQRCGDSPRTGKPDCL